MKNPYTDDPFPEEAEVDEKVLDELTHQACFAADMAYFDHLDDVSTVRNLDGSPQSLTKAEMTQVEIKAGLRNLIANRLISVGTLEEIRAILESGVTLQ